MSRHGRLSRIGRAAALTLALSVLGVPGAAWAGELRFADSPLAVDGDGKLTKEARSAAQGEVESTGADEEAWEVHVWAQIDKGAEGPLYFEFTREHAGQKLMAYSHEHADYGGEKFISLTIELVRSMGFRFDDTLTVEAIQIEENDKRRVLASGKLTLRKSSKSAPAASGGSGGGSKAGPDKGPDKSEDDASEQDVADSFAGDGGGEGGDAAGPPPAESGDKKGCRVDPDADLPWTLALLLAVGFVARRGRA